MGADVPISLPTTLVLDPDLDNKPDRNALFAADPVRGTRQARPQHHLDPPKDGRHDPVPDRRTLGPDRDHPARREPRLALDAAPRPRRRATLPLVSPARGGFATAERKRSELGVEPGQVPHRGPRARRDCRRARQGGREHRERTEEQDPTIPDRQRSTDECSAEKDVSRANLPTGQNCLVCCQPQRARLRLVIDFSCSYLVCYALQRQPLDAVTIRRGLGIRFRRDEPVRVPRNGARGRAQVS